MEQPLSETPEDAAGAPERLHEYVERAHGIAVASHGAAVPSGERPRRRRARTAALLVLAVFFFLGAAALAAATWFVLLPADPFGAEQEVAIDPGIPLASISADLERRGIVRNALAFTILLRIQERADQVKAGTFVLSPAMTPRRIADILTAQAPSERDVQVTIPEGFIAFEIAQRFASQGVVADAGTLFQGRVRVAPYDFLPMCAAAAGSATCDVRFADLEGYLFPDTYRFRKDASADAIAAKFLENFNAKFSSELRREAAAAGRTVADIVILASLVEEEASSDADRGKIAGILAKRLEIGMALQVDATVLYAREQESETASKQASESRVVTIEDLEIDSPYNTYKYAGLPPGPIANPGLKSLLAALRPEPSPYLYYLHTPDGETIFSRTLEEHNQAKARYLR